MEEEGEEEEDLRTRDTTQKRQGRGRMEDGGCRRDGGWDAEGGGRDAVAKATRERRRCRTSYRESCLSKRDGDDDGFLYIIYL